jgi:hypothetical protein
MSWVGFEPTIPAFEWAKTVQTIDRATTVIGKVSIHITINCERKIHYILKRHLITTSDRTKGIFPFTKWTYHKQTNTRYYERRHNKPPLHF